MRELLNSQRQSCVHSRMLDGYLTQNAVIDDLLASNLFLKQHVKMCPLCRQKVDDYRIFEQQKQHLVEIKQLPKKMRQSFLEEIYQVIDEYDNQVEQAEELATKEKFYNFLVRFISEILSPSMVIFYFVMAVIAFILVLLI